MSDKYLCPKCGKASYAPTLRIHVICSFCDFDFHKNKPDRRLSKRSQIKEFITLELADEMFLQAVVVNTSAKGVGVILSNHSNIKKGDTLRYSFGKKGKRGDAKVVWFKEGPNNEEAGLLLN